MAAMREQPNGVDCQHYLSLVAREFRRAIVDLLASRPVAFQMGLKMKTQNSGDARLPGNILVTELAHRGLLADPGLREASRLLLEKLGFDPDWVSELIGERQI
jgi:hypothetical protein